jgi:hypothetical protein
MSPNFPRKAGGEAVQGIELSAEVPTFVKLHQGKENHLWDFVAWARVFFDLYRM